MVDRAHGLGMLTPPAHGIRRPVRTCVRALEQPDDRRGRGQRGCPGYRDPATVRRFDAPEALDIRFYEIHAKSAINRVPEASQMPFRWTINPYRGCTHACTYCIWGDTPILMADGSHQPLGNAADRRRDLRHRAAGQLPALRPHAGARPLGERQAGVPRGARGRHRAHRQRRSPLPHASAAGSTSPARSSGRDRRPHLTIGSSLLGTGAFAAGPAARRRLRARLPVRDRPRRRQPRHLHLRPAEADVADRRAPLQARAVRRGGAARAERYLLAHGVHATSFAFHAGSDRTAADARDPDAVAVAVRPGSRAHPLAAEPERRVAQGLPRRHLRRRGLGQRRHPHQQRRRDDPALDRRPAWTRSGFATVLEGPAANGVASSASAAACASACASFTSSTRRSAASSTSTAWR